MHQITIPLAALAFVVTGCGSPAVTPGPVADKSSPGLLASSAPVVSPSPAPVSGPLLVFLNQGAVALVQPDGTVVDMEQTPMDSDDVAKYEFDRSDAALIGHWGPSGSPTSPLTLSVFDRNGSIRLISPAAAKVLGTVDIFRSPIIVGGQDLLVIDAKVPQTGPPTSSYIKVDLATGKVTSLLTATSLPDVLPPGGLGLEPHEVNMEPLGTTSDGSVARLMVVHAIVNGVSIAGAAYFDIDLKSLKWTGPHALPDVGPVSISADASYVAWNELRVVGGKGIRDLHILELATGRQATISNVPFVNEAVHGGIKFSPDDSYLSLQGFGAGSMGIAVFDLRSNRLVRSIAANQPDEPLGNVPLWWTDSHTVVYQTSGLEGFKRGHRLDVVTGTIADYPSGLGALVLVLA